MIVSAAIRYPDGEILAGKRHSLIIAKAAKKKIYSHTCEQGFLTSNGQFVNRATAAVIAVECGQLLSLSQLDSVE